MTNATNTETETMTTAKKVITYYYRGQIERGIGGGYAWREGYSEESEDNHPLYPWSTKRECQQAAKKQGAKAVFVRDKEHQIA